MELKQREESEPPLNQRITVTLGSDALDDCYYVSTPNFTA